MAKQIIIDTDTGVDDALGIILALNSPELSVEAITTVAGNVEVEKCTRNIFLILELLQVNRALVVAQGEKKPLRKALFTAPEVHGSDGLGNITKEYPRPKVTLSPFKAFGVIINLAKKYPKQLTIVALGPMTNLAKAIRKDSRAMKQVKEIIAMGGAFRVFGNTGPLAEFNMFVDPDAAQIVLHAGIPLTLVPLDVTQQLALTREDVLTHLRKKKNPKMEFISKATKFYMKYHQKTEGWYGGYLHDPLAISVAIRPEILRCVNAHVDVEIEGTFTRGMTVAKLRKEEEERPSNARIAVDVDKKRFWHLFHSRVWS